MFFVCFVSNIPAWKKPELLMKEVAERNGKPQFPPDSKKWFDPEEDKKARNKFWAAPFDARFPQTNKAKLGNCLFQKLCIFCLYSQFYH